MKKSEVLKILEENVKSYYTFGDNVKILAVYVNCLDWEQLKLIGKYIIDIVPQDEETIRICFSASIVLD